MSLGSLRRGSRAFLGTARGMRRLDKSYYMSHGLALSFPLK